MRVRLIQVEERNHASSACNVKKRLQRLESTPECDNAGIQVLNPGPVPSSGIAVLEKGISDLPRCSLADTKLETLGDPTQPRKSCSSARKHT